MTAGCCLTCDRDSTQPVEGWLLGGVAFVLLLAVLPQVLPFV